MKVIIQQAAQDDVAAAAEYLAERSQRAARNFIAEIRKACLSLNRQALRWPLYGERQGMILRRAVCGNYLIFYRLDNNTVEIARILHGARDYSELFNV